MPANPVMADKGAQDYWLYCSPCHGDQAQGLTDEFRKQYPTEDQFCWNSGCHGNRPYPNGWTIPRYVPALVGPGALMRFPDGAVLKAYIQQQMPFQTPGILKEAEYWRITAFLLRQNGYWSGDSDLTKMLAEKIIINRDSTFSISPTTTMVPALISTPTPAMQQAALQDSNGAPSSPDVRTMAVLGIIILIVLSIIVVKGLKKW